MIALPDVVLLLISLGLGACGALVFALFGSSIGFTDFPNKRSSHNAPVPKGAGVGLLTAFIFAALHYQLNIFFWLPVALLSLLGLISDRMEISPFLRLAAQLSLALILFAAVERLGYDFPNYLVAACFWSIFIAATANAFNFMDGINGIAGISGMIAFGFTWFFIGSIAGANHSLSIIAGCIVFACAGFLPFNLPKARAFMGDTGSLFLGFLFGGFACIHSNSIADFGVFIAFLFPFYADTVTTLLVRIKEGENILQSHRRHLYQLLTNELSIQHWKIALLYGVLQVITGTTAIMAHQAGSWAVFLLLGLFSTIFTIVSWKLRKKLESKEILPRDLKQRYFSGNIPLVLMADLILVVFSLWVSCVVRFNQYIPLFITENLQSILPIIVIIKLSVFSYFDFYRGMWRYTSLSDLFNIIKASIFSTLFIVTTVLFVHGFEGFPRSVFIVDAAITIVFISAFRLFVRFYYERLNNSSSFDDFSMNSIKSMVVSGKSSAKKLLIIGAGDCGEKILREIQNNPGVKYEVVGFLDDDPRKMSKKIHGVLVLNTIEFLESAARRVGAEEILIAVPSATAINMKRIIDICETSGLKFKTIPNMGELINGTVTVGAIRDVSFRDLLGRRPVELDQEQVGICLDGKKVLVTGAGGSIGSELCRQICRFRPSTVIVVDNAETPLFEIDYELHRHFPGIKTVAILADIQKKKQVKKIFSDFRPEVVFHAAAYKHVAMLETHPWKAVINNIMGTVVVTEAAIQYQTDRFVFVSTDKAVMPTSVMGASKRISEIYIQNQNCQDTANATKFITVRFGNVAGSAGSVVPLFKKQIKEGGPVTVTHPEVTRFFMTIPEACQLILQAGAMGHGREIFILDMGRPIKILDMAKDVIRLYGFEPEKDIEIEFIGLRKGEKLFEELVSEGESVVATAHRKIMVLKSKRCSLDRLNGCLPTLEACAESHDETGIINEFQRILPDYVPSSVADSFYPPN